MRVFGLALDEDSQVPVLILKDAEDKQVLPIWIGAMEAMAISLAINDVQLPRPMTHDLFLSMVKLLEAEIVGVEIVGLQEGTYYAEILLVSQGGPRRMDARPSDAIALALRAKAPILVSEDVLREVSLGKERERYKSAIQTEDSEKWTDLLEKFSLDETKYKM